MKARIPAKSPLVLLYRLGGSTPKGQLLRRTLDAAGLPYREISPSQLNQTFGALAASPDPAIPPYEGQAPDCEFLGMCHFTSPQVNALLEQLRKAGVPKIDLKAVLTESNQGWPILQLLVELRREHEVMEVYSRLVPLIREAESLPEENQDPVLWNSLNQAILAAKGALSAEEPTSESLTAALENLLAARSALR